MKKKRAVQRFSRGSMANNLLLKKMILLTVLILTIFTTSPANSSYSETIKFNLNQKDVTVEKVFQHIEKNSEFILLFNEKRVNVKRRVNINVKNEKVERLLDQTFEGTRIDFKVYDRQIVIVKNEKAENSADVRLQIADTKTRQPQQKEITGKVIDIDGIPLPGVNILEVGTNNGSVSDLDGNYSITVSTEDARLNFSFVGYLNEEIRVGEQTNIDVTLIEDIKELDEIVVVGYAVQKKESVVGSISVTSSEDLGKRSGSTNLGTALSGQMAGVTVLQQVGQPGSEDPRILIRGQSTWNDAEPLILVDGIERSMNDVDISEVSSVSVLKDASATAVFGVKGANGVILITTKRGLIGKPKLSFFAQYSIESTSKLFNLLDSYDERLMMNEGIEREIVSQETSWDNYMPYELALNYKKPQKYPEAFPNINWSDLMLKDFKSNHKFNMNIQGGTSFVKYFGSVAYSHQGDIFDMPYNDRGYQPGFYYNRLNYRGNFDFNISKTTDFSVNISGYNGQQSNVDFFANERNLYNSLYSLSPSVFYWRYSDGYYGKNPDNINRDNPYALLYTAGLDLNSRNFLGTDAKLRQELGFITEGLSFSANVSFDTYVMSRKKIEDSGDHGTNRLYKYLYPEIINAKTKEDSAKYIIYFDEGSNEFEKVISPVNYNPEEVKDQSLTRSLFYQLSFNYDRTFDKHDVGALILMNRRENAKGSVFPSYREDFVGRLTYNYNRTYFLETNAAYNGSEKFSSDYRYGFFPSFALGWMVSNENFMEKFIWLTSMKLRASVGKVGSDAGIPRWGYQDSWRYLTGNKRLVRFGYPQIVQSPYEFYMEDVIANPNLRWETALKQNIGLDMGLFENTLRMELDFFLDKRSDIFLNASERTIPVLFGAEPVPANIGKTETKGYEISLSYRKRWINGWSMNARFDFSKAIDKIVKYEDALLLDDYLKKEGFAIGQTRTTIREGFLNNWDEVYASASEENNKDRLPGDWSIIDYNGDGIVNEFDIIPFGYPDRPQMTYSSWLGFGYKGFDMSVQFYAQRNSNINMELQGPSRLVQNGIVEQLGDYWTPENTDAYWRAPRVETNAANGERFIWDATFLRLKMLEISYALPDKWVSSIGISKLQLFVNGSNLLLWSNLPVDIETRRANNSYPITKTYNCGLNLDF